MNDALKFVVIFMVLFLCGCPKDSVKPDTSMSAYQAQYRSAEFYACNKHFVGLGVCLVKEGTKFSDLKASVQGYYEGNISFSSSCGDKKSFEYKDNQVVASPDYGVLNDSCVVEVVVTPKYKKDGAVVVSPLRGTLLVSVIKSGKVAISRTYKFKNGIGGDVVIPVGDDGTYRVVFRGCGSTFDKKITSVNGKVYIKSDDIVLSNINRVCAISGAVVEVGVNISMLISIYDQNFIQLPIPYVNYKDGKLEVKADQSVSLISVGDRYEYSNEDKFKVDVTKPFTIRAITAGARSAIGDYIPEHKAVEWIQ